MDPYPPVERIDPLSVSSFVISIFTLMLVWCCCIGYPPGLVALILGAVALSRHTSGGYSPTSRGLAISGVAITLFSFLLHILVFIVLQTGDSNPWKDFLRELQKQ